MELYGRIPETKCKEGCHKCCSNIIQFTPSEERMMGGYSWDGKCGHLQDGKCSTYENRPFVCRLYGASELLVCEDCVPERLLSEDETLAIVREYNEIMQDELAGDGGGSVG